MPILCDTQVLILFKIRSNFEENFALSISFHRMQCGRVNYETENFDLALNKIGQSPN